MVSPLSPSETLTKPVRERKRQREVLDAAAQLFHDSGYSSTTVQDVADALGILKGSLYYYIDTKEDLLFQLLDQVHDEVDQMLEEVKAIPDLAPLIRLETYIRRQVEYNLKNMVRVTVYYHDVDRLSNERRQQILQRDKAHNHFVRSLIRQAQSDGQADASLDANVLCNCVYATIIWTYRWYRKGQFNPEVVSAQCAAYAIGGITGVR